MLNMHVQYKTLLPAHSIVHALGVYWWSVNILSFNRLIPTLIRKVKIPPIWIYLVQRISQSGARDNIDIKDAWFTPYIE